MLFNNFNLIFYIHIYIYIYLGTNILKYTFLFDKFNPTTEIASKRFAS